MEKLISCIASTLENEIPSLWVDIECGQVDTIEDAYPFTTPAVWIDVSNIDWIDTSRGVQHGVATITLRIALDIYQDTHTGAPQRAEHLRAWDIINRIHHVMARHVSGEQFNNLSRIRTSVERRTDGLKVFNMAYRCDITDTSAQHADVPVDVAIRISAK